MLSIDYKIALNLMFSASVYTENSTIRAFKSATLKKKKKKKKHKNLKCLISLSKFTQQQKTHNIYLRL